MLPDKRTAGRRKLHCGALLLYTCVLGLFFAMVEIQIEGGSGWAANLPTWRIESHPLLTVFWGDRPLTGYHAWVFSFMAFVFHLPLFIAGRWNFRLEARVLGALMIFWIAEDFFWFVLNPAYSAIDLFRGKVPWHKHTLLFLPHDYWIFLLLGLCLLWYSFRQAAAGRQKADNRPA